MEQEDQGPPRWQVGENDGSRARDSGYPIGGFLGDGVQRTWFELQAPRKEAGPWAGVRH